MKIMLVITSLGVGGAERLVTSLADRFTAMGHEVLLVTLHGKVALYPENPKVRLANLCMRRDWFGMYAGIATFLRVTNQFRPDVVNSHLVHSNIFTRLLRLIAPIPCLVSSAHNTNEESRLRMLAYRLTDRLATISTNVAEEAVCAFEQQGAVRPGRMVTIHNGIDTDKFTFDQSMRRRIRTDFAIEDDTQLMLAVGRLSEPKDYPNMLKALSLLAGREESILLWIVGDGPLKGDIELLAESLGVADQVRFLGVREDVSALMSACDFYIMSSAWEGLPMVILEAMACGRLIVATDCGAVRRVVGDAGFVIPPGDSEALAAALSHGLSLSLDERKRLGETARERAVTSFSLDATADRYLAVYEGVMKCDSRGSIN